MLTPPPNRKGKSQLNILPSPWYVGDRHGRITTSSRPAWATQQVLRWSGLHFNKTAKLSHRERTPQGFISKSLQRVGSVILWVTNPGSLGPEFRDTKELSSTNG